MTVRYEIDGILLDPYKAVYVEVPKVACTSIKTALAQILGIGLDVTGGNPHDIHWPTPRTVPSRSGPLFPGLFTFAFVRNPWDRLVSCYQDKIGGEVDGYTYFTIRPGVANCLACFDAFVAGMSFDEFVGAVAAISDEEADGHFRSQYTFVANDDGQITLDFVGRFERLTEDFRWIQDQLGLPTLELRRLQAVPKPRKYANFYTRETRRIVATRFREDIEMFGYEFETG